MSPRQRSASPGRAVSVLTGGRRGGPEFLGYADAREGLMALTGMFGALALVIALFVIAGALGLAIQLREREIALLRAIAATPRQVRRMLRWEAVLLALAASAAGYLPGVALAHGLIDAFSQRGLAPDGMEVAGGAVPAIVTVGATVVCALVAAWAGSRRASKVAPTRALQDAAVEPRMIGRLRLLAGLVAVAGGAATLVRRAVLARLRTPRSAPRRRRRARPRRRRRLPRPARGARWPPSCPGASSRGCRPWAGSSPPRRRAPRHGASRRP